MQLSQNPRRGRPFAAPFAEEESQRDEAESEETLNSHPALPTQPARVPTSSVPRLGIPFACSWVDFYLRAEPRGARVEEQAVRLGKGGRPFLKTPELVSGPGVW